MPSVLEDFLSHDGRRVMSATWAVVQTREESVLDPLVAALPCIRKQTADLELGGALHPNGQPLEHAIEKIARYRDGECWCMNHPGLDFYEPKKEQRADRVSIVSTSEPGWSMTYHCRCELCGQEFDVEQGDYHYM